MHLLFRLIGVLARSRKGPRVAVPDGLSSIALRVWPNDLDFNLHMNNGRYLSLMDLGRVDLLARSGLGRTVLAKRWMPVVTGVTIRYRRSLAPFQRFRLETRLVGWDEHFLFLDQRFVISGGADDGMLAANATVRAAFVAKGPAGGKVPVARLFETLGVVLPIPNLPPPSEEVAGPLAPVAA